MGSPPTLSDKTALNDILSTLNSEEKVEEYCSHLKKWVVVMGLFLSITSSAYLENEMETDGVVKFLNTILIFIDYVVAFLGVRAVVKKDIWFILESMFVLQARLLLKMLAFALMKSFDTESEKEVSVSTLVFRH